MDRFTISLDKALASAFDRLIEQRGYTTRSEAVRDILRTQLQADRERRDGRGRCIASLSYVYKHHERELAERLTSLQHAHGHLIISTMHAHIDHEHCLESVLLKGSVEQVRGFADRLIAQRVVRHGSLNLISVELTGPHGHGGARRNAIDADRRTQSMRSRAAARRRKRNRKKIIPNASVLAEPA